MTSNSRLFSDCLRHPEPLVDPFYCSEQLIIPNSPEAEDNAISALWRDVRDRVIGADLALRDGDAGGFERHVRQLDVLLQMKGANFLEFTSFFPPRTFRIRAIASWIRASVWSFSMPSRAVSSRCAIGSMRPTATRRSRYRFVVISRSTKAEARRPNASWTRCSIRAAASRPVRLRSFNRQRAPICTPTGHCMPNARRGCVSMGCNSGGGRIIRESCRMRFAAIATIS